MTALPLDVLARSAIIAQEAVAAGPATAGAPTVSLIRRGAAGQQTAANMIIILALKLMHSCTASRPRDQDEMSINMAIQ